MTVMTFGKADDPRRAEWPFRLIRLAFSRSRTLRLLRSTMTLRALLSRQLFDVVYVGHWRSCAIPLRLAMISRGRRPRIVQAVHGSEVQYLQPGAGSSFLHRTLFKWATRPVARFVALGSYQAPLLKSLGVASERIYVSPEGVHAEPFLRADASRVTEIRSRLGLTERPVLLTVGRMVERKGHDVVLKALPRVLDKAPDIAYLIVGTGPQEEQLRHLAAELHLPSRAVIFCGKVPSEELPFYYHACDIFVMPNRIVGSDVEGFGIVFLEAAAAGKPAIGGRSGGAGDAIVDGVTGLLVDPTSPAALADSVIRLLDDAANAQRLGAAGRDRVLSSYQYPQIASRIRQFALLGDMALAQARRGPAQSP